MKNKQICVVVLQKKESSEAKRSVGGWPVLCAHRLQTGHACACGCGFRIGVRAEASRAPRDLRGRNMIEVSSYYHTRLYYMPLVPMARLPRRARTSAAACTTASRPHTRGWRPARLRWALVSLTLSQTPARSFGWATRAVMCRVLCAVCCLQDYMKTAGVHQTVCTAFE